MNGSSYQHNDKKYAQNEAPKYDLVLGRMLLSDVVFELFPLHQRNIPPLYRGIGKIGQFKQ